MKTLFLPAIVLCFSFTAMGAENAKAKIEADKQAGFLPLTVRFACPEQSPDVVYLWDFGNGNTSLDRTPQSLFVNPGSYKVKLVVRNHIEADSATYTIEVLPNSGLIKYIEKMRAGIK